VSHRADRFSYRLTIRTLYRMTQRLVIPSREEVDGELSVARPWWQFSVRFNVAISHSIPVARMHECEVEGVMMRWGLAQKTAHGAINFTSCGSICSYELKSAQDLSRMWVDGQRAIVPLAGFYLWQRAPAGHDQPYYVRLVNRPVFGVAALWERAEASEEVIESCALITVDANPLLSEIDPGTGQMPAILRSEDYKAWLSSSLDQAHELLRPYPHTRMVCHPVAPYVNHLELDEPSLIRPADR
jgi:putative SOS response-associated peptidase YedK